jgi:hypothetical protein
MHGARRSAFEVMHNHWKLLIVSEVQEQMHVVDGSPYLRDFDSSAGRDFGHRSQYDGGNLRVL